MSHQHNQATAPSDVEPLAAMATACFECGTPHSSLHVPHSLSCGHVVCAECATAVTIISSPMCTVCKAKIAPDSVPMSAFAAFCDSAAEEPPVLHEADMSQDAALRVKAEHYLVSAAVVAEARGSFADKVGALQDSADAAVATVFAETERVKAKLDALCAERVARIRRYCKEGVKQLEAQHDELVVRESQLRAGAQFCASAVGKGSAAQVLASLKSFDTLACKPVINEQPTITVRAVRGLLSLRERMHMMRVCVFSQNEVIAKFLDDYDAWMLVVRAPAAVVCVRHFRVTAFAFVGHAQKYNPPSAGVFGECVKSLPIATASFNRGIAISPGGSQFAVLNSNSCSISIYAVADGAHIRTFGGEGVAPGKFRHPQKLVYHPDSGNILVADRGNMRVQEVRPTGEAVQFIGAGVIDVHVNGIACNGPLVAVGTCERGENGGVMLFEYASGALVRSFGDWGAGVGQLGSCAGMRFSADGRHIVVANGIKDGSFRLSQWSVEGAFVKEVGRGALKWVTDVELAGDGDWIACDNEANEMIMFSGDTGAEVRRWGGKGVSDGKFQFPIALAQSNVGELWVLDQHSDRAQVFV